MFNFFKKALGIQLSPTQLILQEAGKEPEIIALPPNTISEKGELLAPETLKASLHGLQMKYKSKSCAINLAANKCFNGVLILPAEMSKEEALLSLKQKANSLLPIKMKDLVVETAVYQANKKSPKFAFIAGVEKSYLESLNKVLTAAGWKEISFISEGLALAKALGKKSNSNNMLIQLQGKKGLTLSLFEGYLTDSFLSKNLSADLPSQHKAYKDLLNTAPQKILTVGELNNEEAKKELSFIGEQPEITHLDLEDKQNLITTGLVQGFKETQKRGGLALLALLD